MIKNIFGEHEKKMINEYIDFMQNIAFDCFRLNGYLLAWNYPRASTKCGSVWGVGVTQMNSHKK